MKEDGILPNFHPHRLKKHLQTKHPGLFKEYENLFSRSFKADSNTIDMYLEKFNEPVNRAIAFLKKFFSL